MGVFRRINPTSGNPYRSICQLEVTFPNGTRSAGSGCFVGRRVILTVAHVVYDKGSGGAATSIDVFAGRNGTGSPPQFQARTTLVQFKEAFIPKERRRRDFAAIILPASNRLPTSFPLFVPWRRKRRKLRGMNASLTGYPGNNYGEMWEDREKIKRVRKRIIRYRHTALAGQSGAPLWTMVNGQPRVVGIHRGDWALKEEGLRIDRARRDWLKQLIANFS